MQLNDLSDDELVSRITAICLEGHRLTAKLIQQGVDLIVTLSSEAGAARAVAA